ncbi:MAG: uridine phosphorylase, partial [Spirochaetaceae bacterium]
MRKEFPILEYDDCVSAKIEPTPKSEWRVAEHCVLTFFGEVVKKYSERPGTRLSGSSRWETGPVNVYTMQHRGTDVSFVHAWVGAPAVAGIMELVISRGARKIIMCGGCGVLDREFDLGAVLIPTAAVRDEGTSYHYLPPSREV